MSTIIIPPPAPGRTSVDIEGYPPVMPEGYPAWGFHKIDYYIAEVGPGVFVVARCKTKNQTKTQPVGDFATYQEAEAFVLVLARLEV